MFEICSINMPARLGAMNKHEQRNESSIQTNITWMHANTKQARLKLQFQALGNLCLATMARAELVVTPCTLSMCHFSMRVIGSENPAHMNELLKDVVGNYRYMGWHNRKYSYFMEKNTEHEQLSDMWLITPILPVEKSGWGNPQTFLPLPHLPICSHMLHMGVPPHEICTTPTIPTPSHPFPPPCPPIDHRHHHHQF